MRKICVVRRVAANALGSDNLYLANVGCFSAALDAAAPAPASLQWDRSAMLGLNPTQSDGSLAELRPRLLREIRGGLQRSVTLV